MQHPKVMGLLFQIYFTLLYIKWEKTLPLVKMPPFDHTSMFYISPIYLVWQSSRLHCFQLLLENNFNLPMAKENAWRVVSDIYKLSFPPGKLERSLWLKYVNTTQWVMNRDQNHHRSFPDWLHKIHTKPSSFLSFSTVFGRSWKKLSDIYWNVNSAWKRRSLRSFPQAINIIYNFPQQNEVLNNLMTGQLQNWLTKGHKWEKYTPESMATELKKDYNH